MLASISAFIKLCRQTWMSIKWRYVFKGLIICERRKRSWYFQCHFLNFVYLHEKNSLWKPYAMSQNCLDWSNYQNKWCHWMILVCLCSFCLPNESTLIQIFRNTWNTVICDSIFVLKCTFKTWSYLSTYWNLPLDWHFAIT